MNRKLIMLLAIVLALVFVFLVGQYGTNVFSTKETQATYLKLSSDDLQFKVDEGGKVSYYYYIEKLEENENYAINLADFIDLDPEATNDKSSLSYSIVVDNEADASKLDLVSEGPLKGRLTISGQASAIITISTTDGSGITAELFIRPYVSKIDEHHGGEGFN